MSRLPNDLKARRRFWITVMILGAILTAAYMMHMAKTGGDISTPSRWRYLTVRPLVWTDRPVAFVLNALPVWGVFVVVLVLLRGIGWLLIEGLMWVWAKIKRRWVRYWMWKPWRQWWPWNRRR